jgi:hypothetical protein
VASLRERSGRFRGTPGHAEVRKQRDESFSDAWTREDKTMTTFVYTFFYRTAWLVGPVRNTKQLDHARAVASSHQDHSTGIDDDPAKSDPVRAVHIVHSDQPGIARIGAPHRRSAA